MIALRTRSRPSRSSGSSSVKLPSPSRSRSSRGSQALLPASRAGDRGVSRGATFVSDSIAATDKLLSTEFGQKLKDLGVCYHRNLTDRDAFAGRTEFGVYNHWQKSFDTEQPEVAASRARDQRLAVEWGPDRLLKTRFYCSAFEYYDHLDRNVLYSSLADHGMWFDTWPLVQHLPYAERPLHMTFGDDSEISPEEIQQWIDLYDELLFETTDAGGITLVCDGKYKVAANKDNLVYKAADILCESENIKPNIKITVTKNIPIGAGLGGGSSDAASTLLGLNKFLNLNISDEKLHTLAASLGSDMNFFLGSPLAFCTGRGEKTEKIEKIFPFKAILLTPNITVPTKEVYVNYKHDAGLYNELSQTINGLIREKNVDLLAPMCANMLADSCFQLHRQLADLKSRVEGLGLPNVVLSGSGSTMYCLLTNEEDIEGYQAMINSIGCDCLIVNNNRW